MKAIRLNTDYRNNPLGIDNKNPRFTWNCEGGIKQTAYRLVAEENGRILFDSGKVESDSMNCRYEGEPLQSRQRVNWSVQIWDESGNDTISQIAWFEMGLLDAHDWQAKWIAGVDTNRQGRRSG